MPDEPYAEEILGGYDGIHMREGHLFLAPGPRADALRKSLEKRCPSLWEGAGAPGNYNFVYKYHKYIEYLLNVVDFTLF